ncbi:MAG: universal stress protein [Kiloniellales bacterium]|nr:universal stress protein [Kiloniellales bacterium]
MTIRRILVPVRGDDKGERVLDHAVALARRFAAHVDVLHCRARPEDMLPYGVSVPAAIRENILASARGVADQEERKVREAFDAYCAKNGLTVVDGPPGPEAEVSLSWREEAGKQAAVVALHGRLADLIVVAQPDRERNLGHNTLEAALLETGKPVLLCPPRPAGSLETLGAHIAVAWNGSAEAAQAVTMGLPVLAAAENVTVIALTDGAPKPLGPEALKDYLASHGIAAEVATEKSKATAVGGALLKIAKERGADLLLMGAYGQSRRRELVLGGVTQHVIDHADLPVLLTH